MKQNSAALQMLRSHVVPRKEVSFFDIRFSIGCFENLLHSICNTYENQYGKPLSQAWQIKDSPAVVKLSRVAQGFCIFD